MKCLVHKSFTRKGIVQNVGDFINVPENMLLILSDHIQVIATADDYTEIMSKRDHDAQSTVESLLPDREHVRMWPPVFKAWLTPKGELRTTGVCEDLASEIVKLTMGNHTLQSKLLRECCGMYSGPHWKATIAKWWERVSSLESGGTALHDAKYKAAEEMHLLAFSEELQNNKPRR